MTRRSNQFLQERIAFAVDHAELTATTTMKLYKAPAGRKFRLDRALYLNPTGLAADNTNAFSGAIKNGSAIMATLFNTDGNDVPAGASLAADTFVEGVVSTTLAVLAAGETLDITFTEDGTATLPAGRIYIEGRLL